MSEPPPSPLPTSVLVVEGDPGILTIAALLLRREGFAVLEASTPKQAAQIVSDHSGVVDLLLVDADLPTVGGVQAARDLAQQWPGLKVLFCSGYPQEILVSQGVLSPDIPLLSKPFRIDELVQKVREMLAR